MKLITAVTVLAVTALTLTNSPVSGQTNQSATQLQNNPLDLFNFKPQALITFLWDSLKSEYKTDVTDIVNGNSTAGNISEIIEGAILEATQNSADAKSILSSSTAQTLLQLIDNDFSGLLKNVDLNNLNLTEIQEDFMTQFNLTELANTLTRPILADLQNMTTFENITAKVKSTLQKLERGESIFPELKKELSSLINMASAVDTQLLSNVGITLALGQPLKDLSAALVNTTQALAQRPDWEHMPYGEQLLMVLTTFDYTAYGRDILSVVLSAAQDNLSATQSDQLEAFITNLQKPQRGTGLGVEASLDTLSQAYEAMRKLLNQTGVLLLPELQTLSFDMLDTLVEELGVYSAIESVLYDTMETINNDPSLFTQWNDTQAVTNTERLYMVMTHVSFTDIGQATIGNILNTISEKSRLTPMMYQRVRTIFFTVGSQLSLRLTEDLANKTADALVSSLMDSFVQQNSSANWTSLENSERLMLVITSIDYQTLGSRLLSAILTYAEDQLAAYQSDITEVLTLIEGSNSTELVKKLNEASDNVVMMIWNRTTPIELNNGTLAVMAEIADQLNLTQSEIVTNQNNRTRFMLDAVQQNYSSLGDLTKLGYISASVNFSVIGEKLKDEAGLVLEARAAALLGKLDKSDAINSDLMDLIKELKIVFFLPITDEILQSSVLQVLINNINDQFMDMYKTFNTGATWQANNPSSTMKVMNLVMTFDYAEAGSSLIWELLKVADTGIAVNVSPVLNDMLENIEKGKSISDNLEKLRKIYSRVTALRMLADIPKDALRPIYDELDRQIQNMDQQALNKLASSPGTLQKIAVFAQNLNTTTLGQTLLATAGRVAQNMIIKQASTALPASMTDMIHNYMLSMGSGGLDITVRTMLNQTFGSNMVLNRLTNSAPVQAVVSSLTSSLMSAYESAEKSSGISWTSLSAPEKLIRLLRELNIGEMLQKASQTGNTSLQYTMGYYNLILNPTLSPQCTADLSQFVSDLQGMSFSSPNSMWAAEMIDAWGKPPSGILHGRFKWPGEMNECSRIKADRVTEKPDGTKITEADAIRGSWAMVGIDVKGMLGGASIFPYPMPNLELGICLPDSCDYNDMNMTMSRVSALGGKITYIKRKVDYPTHSGAWKTDPKFIGVSFFFGFLLGTVIICTIADKCIAGKSEKKSKEKEINEKGEKYAMEPIASTQKAATNGKMTEHHYESGSVVYDGADKTGHENKAYEAEEQTSDVEASKTNGHAVRETTQAPEPPKSPPPKLKMSIGMSLIKSFSLYETVPKMLDSSPKPNQLQALDGIRFLSMTWVILGHVYILAMLPGLIQNPKTGIERGKDGDWTIQGVAAGFYAVDSFFLMSGLLVGYLFLKTLSKIQKKQLPFTLVMYYVHRYIRLLPLYAGIILISIGYENYLSNGPFGVFFVDGVYENPCVKNWWTNLLYINNVVNDKQMCNGVSWYLANDMQFYWITPFILLPLYWVPKLGFTIITALFAVHLGVTGWMWGKRKGGSQLNDGGVFNEIYIKPYARIGPYLIGLILAYILFKKYKVKSKIIRAVWWLISLGGIALCVYIPYDATKEGGIFSSSWTPIQRAIYETLCKSGWAICLGWIIFASNTNCRGPIGDVLSWPGWAPLSKLTYAAYLIHPLVQYLDWRNRFTLIYYDDLSMTFDDIYTVFISYAIGAVLHLLLEAPMLGLEKIILPRRK